MINDTDWELLGKMRLDGDVEKANSELDTLDYVLEDKDEVVFISTLHGG